MIAVLLLAGCAARPPVAWSGPVAGAADCGIPAPAAVAAAFRDGVLVPGDEAAALFPELEVQAGWVHRARIRADAAALCGDLVLLGDPEIAFFNRRGERLDVGVVTGALLSPHLVLGLHREDVRVSPPDGAWIATDRQTLRRVGWVAVGAPAP